MDAREALKKKFNTEPSESDIDWYLLNNELLTNFENNNWGFYRSTKFQMAEHLRKEHKYQDALKLYFEVLYIDLNGPINVGKKRAGKIFEASMGMAPPGVVKKAVKMTKKLDMETDEIENKFLNVATNIYNKNFPIQPDEAWLRVKRDF
mgnify:CR=1 FL=1